MTSVRQILAAGAAGLQFISCVLFLLHNLFVFPFIQNTIYTLPNLTSCIALGAALLLFSASCTALLINALDNAIQAAARLPAGQRWIEIELFSKEHLFHIGLSNSADTAPSAAGKHGGKEDHGYGLIIMRRIVERHAGLMDYSLHAGAFRLSLLLPIQTAEPEQTLDEAVSC